MGNYWGNIWSALKGKGIPDFTSRGAEITNNNLNFFGTQDEILFRDDNSSLKYKEAYDLCSPLSSVIDHKAKAYADGTLEVLNPNNDKYVRGQYKEWETLLNKPNWVQSGRQFFRQLHSYVGINGYAVVLKQYGIGFRDIPVALWVLPYWCIEVKDKSKPPHMAQKDYLKQGFSFSVNGVSVPLNSDDIILITDESGDLNENTWLPNSRIRRLSYPLTTLISSAEAETTIIQRKGALGIFSNEAKDAAGHQHLLPEDKKDLQRDMQQYGMTRMHMQYIVTSANLKWQSTSFPVKDLMLHDSYYKSIKDICHAYDFPYELTPHSDRKNLANVKSFDTILYQNAIIPEANSIDEQLTMGLLPEKIKVRHDYTHVAALQQSEKEKGEGKKAMNEALKLEWDNNLITLNMWLTDIGRDIVSGNEMYNKYKNELTPEERGIANDLMNNNAANNEIVQ